MIPEATEGPREEQLRGVVAIPYKPAAIGIEVSFQPWGPMPRAIWSLSLKYCRTVEKLLSSYEKQGIFVSARGFDFSS